ncbi:hypothetical protein Q1695_000655 [Nippostrongylus brasiliensis]|nr:hypothetical protein Q1695_000655 [Nippostrongylus brasiliensis]
MAARLAILTVLPVLAVARLTFTDTCGFYGLDMRAFESYKNSINPNLVLQCGLAKEAMLKATGMEGRPLKSHEVLFKTVKDVPRTDQRPNHKILEEAVKQLPSDPLPYGYKAYGCQYDIKYAGRNALFHVACILSRAHQHKD